MVKKLILIMLTVLLLSGCIASSKSLQETNANVANQARLLEQMAKDQKTLKEVVIKYVPAIPPEVGHKLIENSDIIIDNTEEVKKNAEATEKKNVSIWSFEGAVNAVITLAKTAAPYLTVLSSLTGLPPGLIEGAITTATGLYAVYATKKHSNLKKETALKDEVHRNEKKKLKEDVLIAERLPPENTKTYREAVAEVRKS